MFQNLPLEVFENLCFYVEVEDLVNVWGVVGMEGSESFWKKICKRQCYKIFSYENSLWKNIFLRNINWLTSSYVKRTYELDTKFTESRQTDSAQNKEFILGKHLIINSCGEESLVWNLSSSPILEQSLSGKCISHKGNKLFTYSSSEVTIYSYNTHTLSKLYELPVKLPLNCLKLCSFTEDYLVTLDNNTAYITILDLRELTESSLKMPVTMAMIFSLTLSNNLLFILILEQSNYKIKSFSLMDKTWLQDLVVFKCAALIGVPQLEISSNLIVSWSNQLEGPGITPVKVFSLDGKYIASLPFTNCVESSGTEIGLQLPIENILWMIVECDYLIFSTSKTTISIWSPENLNCIKVIPKEDKLHKGQKVVSSSLLVLSYSHCFKVVDFKKPVYLYEVLLDNHSSLNSIQSLNYLANEYFYIHFQYCEQHKDSDSKTITMKKCFLHIYDFTGSVTFSS